MRRRMLAFVAIGTALGCASAHAQTYDPSYPVCLQVFGPTSYFECSYTSLSQCKLFEIGRSAQCIVNPYFAGAGLPRPSARYRRHHHRAY